MKAVAAALRFSAPPWDAAAFYRYRLTSQPADHAKTSYPVICRHITLAGEHATADLQTPLK